MMPAPTRRDRMFRSLATRPRRIVFTVMVGLFGLAGVQAHAQTASVAVAADGSKIVTVAWFAEAFSTTITSQGVSLPVPTTTHVCKVWPRTGYGCRNVTTGGASYYTAFSGAYSAADQAQCVVASTSTPQLPISCVGNLGAAAGFLVSFHVVGSGTITIGQTVLVVP